MSSLVLQTLPTNCDEGPPHVAQKGNEKIASHILEAGDLVKTETFEKHAFKSLEDSIFYVFTRGPKVEGDHISDTYRLTTPLHDLLERQ